MAAEIALSDLATLQAASTGSRTGGPNITDYDKEKRYYKVACTVPSGAAAADWFTLGCIQKGGVTIIPSESFIQYDTGSTGTFTSVLTLSKVSTAGTVVDVSGPVTVNGLVADYFADFAAATTYPTVAVDDVLRLYITTLNTATAARTFNVWVAYTCKNQ